MQGLGGFHGDLPSFVQQLSGKHLFQFVGSTYFHSSWNGFWLNLLNSLMNSEQNLFSSFRIILQFPSAHGC